MESSEIRTQFEQLKPRYERLAKVVKTVLTQEFARAAFDPSTVIWRVKELNHFLEKIERKGYAEPFKENEDFAGIRVVCRYTPELDQVCAIIKAQFAVVTEEDVSERLDVNEMGYLGRHYVVRLVDDWQGPHYDGLSALKCEIQVRTICQDAWAQIDRHLNYASPYSLPQPIKRELYRMAVLLETAQQSFDGIVAKRDEYAREVSADQHPAQEFLSQGIDRETVRAYALWKYPHLPIKDNILELFLRDLDHSKYNSLGEIDQVVEKARPFNERFQRTRPDRYGSGLDYLTKAFGYVDTSFRAKHPFALDTKTAFVDVPNG